jgi:dihydrofolate reductase
MTKVLAGITTSVDGYITGPDDGPGKGLGEGGERLHYWVFGGPWTYDAEPRSKPTGEDAAWLAETITKVGAVVGGRGTYEAAGHWGDENPRGLPFFIVTHRPEEEAEGGAFTFVSGVKEAIERAVEAAGGKDVACHGRSRRHPPGTRRRASRGAADHHRAGDPGRREAPVRWVLELAGPRAPRREAVAVRDVHRLPGEASMTVDETAAVAS